MADETIETPTETRRLLACLKERLQPEGDEMFNAGRALLRDFAIALKAEGFYFRQDRVSGRGHEAGLEYVRRKIGVDVNARGPAPGIEMWVHGPASTGDDLVKGLKYDALMKIYVGTEPDPDIVPTPGQPYPKKDALRVMVERFAELMTQA